ncbi:MAG: TIGR02391 family protein [Ruminococcus sp.]|nr:TIGR02391 family protein [Ruminococcus sp.]
MNRIYNLKNYLNYLSSCIFIKSNSIHPLDVTKINEIISLIAKEIEITYPNISKKLIQAKEKLFFYNNFGIVNPNPFVVGQILAYVDLLLDSENNKQSNEWSCIHSLIVQSSQKLYVDGSYAEAAVNAFIEINARVKRLYKIVRPDEKNIPDGVEAMNKVFSEKNTIIEICDRTTETGNNIHNGTRFMLAGAMSALRNPKAHSNDERNTVTKEEAMRRLMFASLLMYKIDDAVKYSGITE